VVAGHGGRRRHRRGAGHRDVEVLSGAPTVMKVLRQLRRRGPGTGVAVKGSRHGGNDRSRQRRHALQSLP
jgi:hypothetical protein